jgi:glycosyltransferase involved in cell wall biosynthesis
MVGPVVKIDPDQLPKRANIHWLGQQPYELLPQLVAGWDVCLMPFALNEATRYISPTKTLEYMAAGKPIVSTGINDVKSMFSDVVRIADDAGSFIQSCRAALDEDGYHRTARLADMQACVWRYSWAETVEAVHRAIEAVLSEEAARTAVAEAEQPALRRAANVVPAALLPNAAARGVRAIAAAAPGQELQPGGDRKVASAGG